MTDVPDVFRQELPAYPLRAILDEAAHELGEDSVQATLARYGVTREEIQDPSVWLSLRFVESIIGDFEHALGSNDFVERATQRGMRPEYIGRGPHFALFFALGSPSFAYRQIPKLTASVNRLGRWEASEAKPGFVRLTWFPTPTGPRESNTVMCRFRSSQLSRIPTLFSAPPAAIDHPRCAIRGDAVCEYEVRWSEPPRRRDGLVGLGVGLATAVALTVAFGLAPGPATALAVLLAIGGWATGRVQALKASLHDRLVDIERHNDALHRLLKTNEQRYAELLEAKAEVDLKVEQRTAELQQAMRQLADTLGQVQELDRVKTDFFSNVSHELRTPLTLILGPLGQLASGSGTEVSVRAAVDIMQRNGNRLLELINQLLDLAKVDAGKMQIARAPTDAVELARQVQARFAAAAAHRNMRLTVQVGGTVPRAMMDAAWMESALTNLVANAVRYAKSTVTMQLERDGDWILFRVDDDGPGIAPEDVARVFDRFAQGSDDKSRKGGTGLGLAIAREAARLHGGDASVSSEPGRGTRFTLRIPYSLSGENLTAESAPPASTTNVASPPGGPASWGPPIPAPSDGPNGAGAAEIAEWRTAGPNAPLVVVVEDDEDLRRFVSSVLAPDYRVMAAPHGAAALALINRTHPDAVVSDVMMPEMDGYELCRRLRAQDRTRSLPILLLTARRDVSRVLEGFEAGADDYVSKPFHARELLARLGTHIRLRRMVSDLAHQERLASLGVLAASLAHQIRNPLVSIIGAVPAIRRKVDAASDPRLDAVFGAVLDSANRIEKLVNDLLNLSRVDQESVARFKPADGLRASINLLDAREPGSTRIEADLDDTVEIEGKAGDVNHVFINLIDNALLAARQGGRVKVRARRVSDTFVLEVGDSGSGVDPQNRELVFAPFWTTRAAGKGTGLGLAIARQVVRQHGGDIQIGDSDLGGALFTVTLPAVRAG